jgi:hypothetical protein
MEKQVPSEQIVVAGQSLGTGVAVQLVARSLMLEGRASCVWPTL